MVRLRPYKRSDGQELFRWIPGEPGFSMWCAGKFRYPITPEQLSAYRLKYEEDPRAWMFTAMDEDGIPVGHFLMRDADYEKETVHLAFVIVDPGRRGNGYGRDMLRQALRFAFEILRVRKVTLRVFEKNLSARYCYKSVGFEETGRQENAYPYGEESWAAIEMAAVNGGEES